MQNSILHFIIITWINFLIVALPPRLRATFTELLIGAILAGSGHLTKALLAVGFHKNYSTYFRMISEGKWSWLKVARQLLRLVMKCFPRLQWCFVIDDFICPRASKKAPQVKYHHEHGKKPNRPIIHLGTTVGHFRPVSDLGQDVHHFAHSAQIT